MPEAVLAKRLAQHGGLGAVVDVVAGGQHACALHVGGRVSCWGRNHVGQLGDGSTTDRYWASAVVGLEDAVKVAVGTGHSCALRENGEVVCWGANVLGLTGDGIRWDNERDIPVAVEPVAVSGVGGMRPALMRGSTVRLCNSFATLRDIVDIEANNGTTCVVDVGGGVACWGQDVADRRVVDGRVEAVSCPLPVYGDIRDAERLLGTECVLRKNGRVACWTAAPSREAFGDYETKEVFEPYVVVKELGGKDLEDLASHNGCTVSSDGLVVCAGEQKVGLVEGKQGDLPGGLEGAVKVSVGGMNELVLERKDSHFTPYTGQIETTLESFGCAVLSDGDVRCWGDNAYGQAGLGEESGEVGEVNAVAFGKPEGVEYEAVNAFADIKARDTYYFEGRLKGVEFDDEPVDCPVMAADGPENGANVLRLDALGKAREFRFEDVAVLVGSKEMEVVLPAVRYYSGPADLRNKGGWEQVGFRVELDGEPEVGDRLRVALNGSGLPMQLGCFINPLTAQGEFHVKQVSLPKMGGNVGVLAGTIELYAGSKGFGGISLEFETTTFATRSVAFDEVAVAPITSTNTPFGALMRMMRNTDAMIRVAEHDWRAWAEVDSEHNYFVANDGTKVHVEGGKATYDVGKRTLLVNLGKPVDGGWEQDGEPGVSAFEMSFEEIDLKPGMYQVGDWKEGEQDYFGVLELQEAADGKLVGAYYRVVQKSAGAGKSKTSQKVELIQRVDPLKAPKSVKLTGLKLDPEDKMASFSLEHLVVFPGLDGYDAYDPAFDPPLRVEDAKPMRFVGLPAAFESVILGKFDQSVVFSDRQNSGAGGDDDDEDDVIQALAIYRSMPFEQGNETLQAIRKDGFGNDGYLWDKDEFANNKLILVDPATLRPQRTVLRFLVGSLTMWLNDSYQSMLEVSVDWKGDKADVSVVSTVRGTDKVTLDLPADIAVFDVGQTLLLLPYLDLKPGYLTYWKALDVELVRGESGGGADQKRVWPRLLDVTFAVEGVERIEHHGETLETLRARLEVAGMKSLTGTVWLEKEAPHRIVTFMPRSYGQIRSLTGDEMSEHSAEILRSSPEKMVPVVSDIAAMDAFYRAYKACEPAIYHERNLRYLITARAYEILGLSGNQCRFKLSEAEMRLEGADLSATCLVPKRGTFKDDEARIMAAMDAAARGKTTPGISCEGSLIEAIKKSFEK